MLLKTFLGISFCIEKTIDRKKKTVIFFLLTKISPIMKK
ncbi:hypothetical protein RV14_GL001961 [Enterococcus ratti]|uniref:Uncharacterized protein n=1 Tax=Enterococcus ratti TaxID=150033 RepID=A0A1L8WPL4_9ENTE|nr:hypothetical protein RV14_GL001961 [Enterococcus ratti]